VRVERHDQFRRRDARPHPEIERVAAHHPSKEKIQPLAAGPCRGTGEEIADAGPLRHAAVRLAEIERERAPREAVERAADILRRPVVLSEKEVFDRSALIDHLPDDPQQRDDVGTARPAMDDGGEVGTLARRVEQRDELRRTRAHDRQHALDRLQDARHASERERSGDEPDDFALVAPLVSADDLNRIRRGIRIVVFGIEPVEGVLQHGVARSGFDLHLHRV